MDGRTGPTVEITIPVLNEAHVIAGSVQRVAEFLREHTSIEAAITIADNGSSDATPRIAQEIVGNWPQVRYLRLDRPSLGAALRESWSTSSADIFGYMDADLATDLRHLKEAHDVLAGGECDMVVATRLAPGARVFHRRLGRTVTSRIFNYLLRRRLRFPGSDAACGFKFLTRNAFERIADGARLSEGLFFGSELVVRAFALGLVVRELPVHWTDARDSRIRVLSSTIDFWREMGRLKSELGAATKLRS